MGIEIYVYAWRDLEGATKADGHVEIMVVGGWYCNEQVSVVSLRLWK